MQLLKLDIDTILTLIIAYRLAFLIIQVFSPNGKEFNGPDAVLLVMIIIKQGSHQSYLVSY